MNRFFGVMLLAIFFFNANAQLAANDSATTSPGNTDMTFYSLQTGQKTTVTNNDWHLAVSVRPSLFPSNTLQGTTIRINEAFGVQAYLIPGFTADSFNTVIDTTGFHIWERLYDSDSILDEGAFNTGKNIAVFNYGWGVYTGPPLHNVAGNKIYLLQLTNHIVKKVWIESLAYDTAWNIKIADIDNLNLQNIHIGKGDYTGKNFVYVNLLNNTVNDKEPLSTDWDLQFLQYSASDVIPWKTTPEIGVWANKGATVAKREGEDAGSNDYSSLTFSSSMNKIGWNWKYPFNTQLYLSGKNFSFNDPYGIEDSLAYFVQTLTGDIYKIVFTAYEGVSTGVIRFYKEKVFVSSVPEIENENEVIFPNPANSVLNVMLSSSSKLKVFDINGREILERNTADKIVQLNTSELANGVYLLAVTCNGNTSVKKFIIAH